MISGKISSLAYYGISLSQLKNEIFLNQKSPSKFLTSILLSWHLQRNILTLFIRWGRASYGGFNKKLEELARRMNSKRDSDDENEEEDEFGVAERLKLIREGKYKTEYLSDSSDSEIESFEEKGKKRKSSQKNGESSTKFMRPE